MKYRVLFGIGAALLALLATGFAVAQSSESGKSIGPSTTAVGLPMSQVATKGAADPPDAFAISDRSITTVVVEQAGSLVIGRSGDEIHIVLAMPNPGWVSTIAVTVGEVVGGEFRNNDSGIRYTVQLVADALDLQIEKFTIDATATSSTLERGETDLQSPIATTSLTTTTTTTTIRPTNSTTGATTTTTPPPATATTQATTTTRAATTITPPTTTTAPTTTTGAVTTSTIEAEVWTQVVVSSAGGSIVVSYRPGEVRLDAVAPAPTFLLEEVDEDPDRVEVVFEGVDVTYTIEAKWEKGELVTDADASGPGAD